MKRRIKISFDVPLPLNELAAASASPFSAFGDIMSPSGELVFAGKAMIDKQGVQFENGQKYSIKMSDLQVERMLGKGQYGVVQLVKHLPTNIYMAMKEVRLELQKSKLDTILMELSVLHRSKSEFIVDFYGAFCVESCVYVCIEYMDGGSIDGLYKGGIQEPIVAKIVYSIVQGLHFLKSELNIIHRDVKPSNILMNTQGKVKLCDFGVSGQLVQSMAKTNIGSQSYMPPERIIRKENYSAKSDVWSLGITAVEMATGSFPFAGDKFDSVFAQLNAIVIEAAPTFPAHFSPSAQEFLSLCLVKDPTKRPTYPEMLQHPWLVEASTSNVDLAQFVKERKR
ncbi:kinase-like domain-containing protein [Gorgonomyces haynaldii]|nr:kinase-like domain-containing protein [Gorgonomyces haynaldii]